MQDDKRIGTRTQQEWLRRLMAVDYSDLLIAAAFAPEGDGRLRDKGEDE